MPEEWENLTRRQKQQRQVDSHQHMVRWRQGELEKSGMSPRDAERKAKDDQTITSNKAHALYQRNDGQK